MYSYVVKGSEDGILGVYTNRQVAVQRAEDYVQASIRSNEHVSIDDSEWFISVHVVDQEDIMCHHCIHASVERFITNN